MTLTDLLLITRDWSEQYGGNDSTAIQVVRPSDNGRMYYHLSDYVVSSAVSGPSLILIPRRST